MAKRGCKLQELVAHTSNVNCVKIGKKECRLLLTGGDDHIVNLWSIGKPTSLMSLCGHTSPVECLAFDSSESLVLGGASSGAIKLWNLEESKMVRTLTGHKSNCTSIEFHPFGEFFASGSQDTDLKIWDIRKKGCIHTYKGHSLGIDAIKFTPEGRWVVSGGRDNVVKVWDLTAGKLLHEFRHDGPIRSLDFHPLEFLLATGSADRTVKFWDLETFEIIGSTRAEATGVRALKFHPDGRTLFCGYDDNMKVYSWEPVICYDSVDIRWSILGDLCISDTKMIACSHHQNSIGIWAAELSLIKPYATNDGSPVQLKHDSGDGPPPSEATGTTDRSTSGSRPATPDTDMKEIKNIYVDYEKPISSKKVRSHHMTKVSPPSAMKETHKLTTKKRTPVIATREKSMSFVVPTIVPRDSADGKVVASPRRRSAGPQGTGSGASIRPVQTRRASNIIGGKSSTASLRSSSGQTYSDSNRRTVDEGSGDFFEDKYPAVNGDRENLESAQCRPRPSNLAAETPVENTLTAKGDTGKINDSTTRVFGRTRSLAEKFERRERPPFGEDSVFETVYTEADVIADRLQRSSMLREGSDFSRGKSANLSDETIIEELIHGHEVLLSGLRSRLTKLQVVKHFWDRNDIKGAIDSMKKLSDHSVQADVISVFIDKMEIINLDILFNLLPVLVHLLDSKIERHAKMSMEMLLKLVANFGEIICSTISAPPAVGVDLHQEQRIQCCRQCFNYLQKVQNTLHVIIRKGGILAKSASELNLVLRDHNIA